MNSSVRFWVLLLAAIVAVVMLTAGSGGSGPPFSPRSVDPDGAKGIVEVLEDVGASVRIGQALPESGDTAALLLQDRLRPGDRDELRTWISNGGVLVVADPFSTFLPRRVMALPDQADTSRCAIDALQEVTDLALPPDAWALDTGFAPACIGSSAQAFVVATPVGNGTVVGVGSRQLFTNEWLGETDAAVLAVSLLAPEPDRASVAFLGPSVVPFGEEDTNDLVATRVWNALLMFGAAFVLYAIHRARRVGQVVAEPLPVHLHGSEVVLQAGLLSERADDPSSAAETLRAALISRATSTLTMSTTDDRERIVDAIAARLGPDRTDMHRADIHRALFSPVLSDKELLDVAQELSRIEDALFNLTRSDERVTSAAGTA